MMTTAIAWIAMVAAGWAILEARRAGVRARAAMATLVEVVGLLETLTEESRLPSLNASPAGAPEKAGSESNGRAIPTASGGYGLAPVDSGIRARIAGLTAQGASVTEICRTLSVSKREVALGLALEGLGRSAAR